MMRNFLERVSSSIRMAMHVPDSHRLNTCTLVAIARDEGPYIAEWLAFHIAVGFTRILVFDHNSTDKTAAIVSQAARRQPAISLQTIPTDHGGSPQIAAYAAALPMVRTPWVAFFDIDEFLVPWRDGSIQSYLGHVPDDVSTVHINWRSFGSSGLSSSNYGLVTEAFTRCAEPDWQYQAHYKTVARTALVRWANIHEIEPYSGRRTLSDFTDVAPGTVGSSDRIVYNGIQMNHYQAKTRTEFETRMRLPRADAPSIDRLTDLDLRWALLDRNEVEDLKITRFNHDLHVQLKKIS